MEDTLREWSVCKVGGYEEKKADGRSEGMAQSNEESQIRKKSLLRKVLQLKKINC